jgi:hypothetical protein
VPIVAVGSLLAIAAAAAALLIWQFWQYAK